ncbi:Hypothetical predicted protein, partial [Pelobates cultripes]
MTIDRKGLCLTSEGLPIQYEYSWLHRNCTSAETHHRRAQGSGRLFSGLLTVNVVFVGAALISSVILSKSSMAAESYQIYLSVLMLVSSAWSLYHLLCTRKKPHAVLLKDHHAGALALRASLVFFGVSSVLLFIFKTGYDAVLPCTLPLEIFFSCTQILFICIQTCLLWISSKDCIQVQHNVTRCGIMLTLATNLLLWFLAVINESVYRERESSVMNTTEENTLCSCPVYSLCWTFQQGYVTLYPFNLEYSLICASMLFVMWKNVGRIENLTSGLEQSSFRLRGVVYGPLLGLVTLLIGIYVFIQYRIQVSVETASLTSYRLYYVYNIILLTAMIVCCVIGILAHSIGQGECKKKDSGGQKEKFTRQYEKKSTAKETSENGKPENKENGEMKVVMEDNLDNAGRKELTKEQLELELDLQWQEGKRDEHSENHEEHTEHRENYTEIEKHTRHRGRTTEHKVGDGKPEENCHIRPGSSKNYTRSIEIILLLGATLGRFSISYYSIVATLAVNSWNMVNSLSVAYSLLMILQHILQNIFIIECMRSEHKETTSIIIVNENAEEMIDPLRRMSLVEMRKVSMAYIESVGHLSTSRRAVKEISLFLVFGNIVFWIMSAFGNQPQYTNGLEREFYGFSAWFSILNFGLPLTVFYRMHSW